MTKNTIVIFIGFASLLFLVWNFIISARIMNYLREHGERVNPATMHFKIFESASKYKRITYEETGKVGKLYDQFLVTFIIFTLILFSDIILVSF